MASPNDRGSRSIAATLSLIALGAIVVLTVSPQVRQFASTAPPSGNASRSVLGVDSENKSSISMPTTLRGNVGESSSVNMPSTLEGFDTALIRGDWSKWYQFSFPENWGLDPATADTQIVTYESPPVDGAPQYAKLEITRGKGLRAFTYPAGTISSTLTIDGRSAVRYDPPSEVTENGRLTCFSTVEVGPATALAGQTLDESARNELRLIFYMMNMSDAQACEEYLNTFAQILTTVDLISDYTVETTWIRQEIANPYLGIDLVTVRRPNGWTHNTLPAYINIASAGLWPGSGPVSIQAHPFQASAYWEGGQEMAGAAADGIRLRHTSVQNGMRTNEYATFNNFRPVKWVVTAPDLTPGSEDYFRLEQALWRVIVGTTFSYNGISGYP